MRELLIAIVDKKRKYIYIYIYMCVCVCVCVHYIMIYTCCLMTTDMHYWVPDAITYVVPICGTAPHQTRKTKSNHVTCLPPCTSSVSLRSTRHGSAGSVGHVTRPEAGCCRAAAVARVGRRRRTSGRRGESLIRVPTATDTLKVNNNDDVITTYGRSVGRSVP